jgi:hypothetical protein
VVLKILDSHLTFFMSKKSCINLQVQYLTTREGGGQAHEARKRLRAFYFFFISLLYIVCTRVWWTYLGYIQFNDLLNVHRKCTYRTHWCLIYVWSSGIDIVIKGSNNFRCRTVRCYWTFVDISGGCSLHWTRYKASRNSIFYWSARSDSTWEWYMIQGWLYSPITLLLVLWWCIAILPEQNENGQESFLILFFTYIYIFFCYITCMRVNHAEGLELLL